jgi:NTE family protein
MTQKRKTVGLVLGSGSDRGLAHIGIIKTLLKHNIPIDYIAGSSIGAVIGAHYALHLEVDSLEEIFKRIMAKPWYLLDFDFKKPSLISNKSITNILKYNLYRDKTFSETKIPLVINATDIDTGEQFIFKEGKIIDAVVSSMSLPGILPPYEICDKHLIDGGLSNAIPVNLIKDFKPDIIIAVDLYNTKMTPLAKYDIPSVIGRTYHMYISKLSEFSKQKFPTNCIILNPDTNETIDSITFKNLERNIKIGAEETEKNIEKIKKLLE